MTLEFKPEYEQGGGCETTYFSKAVRPNGIVIHSYTRTQFPDGTFNSSEAMVFVPDEKRRTMPP